MKKMWLCLLVSLLLTTASAFSQCGYGGKKEIECVRDSILKLHRNDEFYLHIRYMPSIRESIEDYVLTKESDKWTGKYFKTTFEWSTSVGTKQGPTKNTLTVIELNQDSMPSFLKSIDHERLVDYHNSDSVSLNCSEMHGVNCHFILICSNGNVRLIEYPISHNYDYRKDSRDQPKFWQSDYLDNLITKFKQAFLK